MFLVIHGTIIVMFLTRLSHMKARGHICLVYFCALGAYPRCSVQAHGMNVEARGILDTRDRKVTETVPVLKGLTG